MNSLSDTVWNYFNETQIDPNNRFLSWEHCFLYFQQTSDFDEDIAALHLAFYLASWGMYRGSSGLLQKDYKIHIPVISIIYKHKYFSLSKDNITELLLIIDEIRHYYSSLSNGSKITPTDTLVTKIILGTIGCIPAFDRFFIDGYNINSVGSKIKTVNSESINGIISFVEENQDEIELVKSRIYSNGQVYYPTMKIVDMYFWQLGLITDRNSKK